MAADWREGQPVMSPQGPQQQPMGGPTQGPPQGPAPSQPPSLMQQGGVGPFGSPAGAQRLQPSNTPAPPMQLPGNAPGYQGASPTGPGAPPGLGGGPLGPMQIAGRMQNIPKQFINGPGQQGQFGGAPGV